MADRGMTPRQKRTLNRTAKALAELGRDTVEDGEAYNQACAMVARSLGAMIGTGCAMHSMSVDDLHRALETGMRVAQKSAAQSYGATLAFESAQERKH